MNDPVRARGARHAYRRKLPHMQRPGSTLFVTFVTKERRLLPEAARDVVLACCTFLHGTKFQLHAAVVMPDHVHMLFTPLRDAAGAYFGLAEIMNAVKGISSRRVNQLLGRSGALWQTESFDHMLRSGERTREKAEYICANPVRAGLVERDDEYRWIWREWVEGEVKGE